MDRNFEKHWKKSLTLFFIYDNIYKPNTERYRSGYNGTVLKTVVRQRTVGSNPTLSATAGCMLNTARFLIK